MRAHIGTRVLVLLVAAVLQLCLLACGGGNPGTVELVSPNTISSELANRAVIPAPPTAETMKMLEEKLADTLASLGKDINQAGDYTLGEGCEVFDFNVTLIDADGGGPTEPYGIRLDWTERLVGDYDQNGEVNISDLSPLGLYLGYEVVYDDPELHEGNPMVPSGDPTDCGGVPAGAPPTGDSGAFNWRLARIDGDGNSEINIAEVTPLALHWGETISGYNVYRKAPGEADYTLIPNPTDPELPCTITREEMTAFYGGKVPTARPFRYVFGDFFAEGEAGEAGLYSYRIVPYSLPNNSEGLFVQTLDIDTRTEQEQSSGVIAILTANVTEGPAPLDVTFDASESYVSGGGQAKFIWDFDGDHIYEYSSDEDPIQQRTFYENGRYIVKVRVIKAGAKTSSRIASATGSDVGWVEIVVVSPTGNVPPVARAKARPLLGPAPLTVALDASESYDPDGAIECYEWDYDSDGTVDFVTQQSQIPYTINDSSTNSLTLRVVDDEGGFDTTIVPVIVTSASGDWPPTAVLYADNVYSAPPLEVVFYGTGSYDPDGPIVSYEWDLDGDFQFDLDSGASPIISYTYPESGIYNVWLRVTDTAGQHDIARTVVSVNTPPLAGVEADPQTGPGPLTVTLDGSFSTDLDGQIVKYEWDLDGDGLFEFDTGTVPHITHKFYEVGTHQVTLRVTDDLGFTAEHSATITVEVPESNLLPVIVLELTPAPTGDPPVVRGSLPLQVEFDATLSYDPDPDGVIKKYEWDFDGNGLYELDSDLDPTVTHTYEEAGRYDASLRVTDAYDGQQTKTVEIVAFTAGNEPPIASFTVTLAADAPGTVRYFDATASTDDKGAIVEYAWDFDGDGTYDELNNGSTPTTTYIYEQNGVRNAVLRVTDSEGATDKAYTQVVAGRLPVAALDASPLTAEAPGAAFQLDASRSLEETQAVDAQATITAYEWDLEDDGTFEISTGVSPYLTAEYDLGSVGVATPHVRVTNHIGAIDITSVELQVVNDYDEIENNDSFSGANRLDGPVTDPGLEGSFSPNPAGDEIIAVEGIPVIGNEVLGSLGFNSYDGDDDDWFSFQLSDGAHVRVDLLFSHAESDLNLTLYAANGETPVVSSLSISDNETCEYNYRDPGVYFVRANRFLGPGTDYELKVTATPLEYYPENTDMQNPGTMDYDNDDMANADDLQYTIIVPKLGAAWGRLGDSGDSEDWYSFIYSSEVTVQVKLNFAHDIGDLDLYLYNNGGSLLGCANSVDDNEVIWRDLPDPGGSATVYIRATHVSGNPTNYTLSVAYPAGAPTGLTASEGTNNGRISISWSAPVGGNAPEGYDLYWSDSEYGAYSLLVSDLHTTSYTLVLANPEDHIERFWFKATATIEGEADSDFSNADLGYSNGLFAPQLLSASYMQYLDKVNISFYDSPTDPSLGTGLFGVEPQMYRLFADPADSKPNTLIATFMPGDGMETFVPAHGGYPERPGEMFSLTWLGGPDWTFDDLKGLNITFTVSAYRAYYPEVTSSGVTGGFNALGPPAMFSATQGVFPDLIRVSWSSPVGEEPQHYILQYKGEFDTGWSTVDPPINHIPGNENYDLWEAVDTHPRTYRIRSYKEGIGASPWAHERFGYGSNDWLQAPSYSSWWLSDKYDYYGQERRNLYARIGRPALTSIMPLYCRARYWRGDWYSWTSWYEFDREQVQRDLYITFLTYFVKTERRVQVQIAWKDPTEVDLYEWPDTDDPAWHFASVTHSWEEEL